MAKQPMSKKTTETNKKEKETAPKARIRKLTKVELEQVVGGYEQAYTTYSRFAGNSGRWGDTC